MTPGLIERLEAACRTCDGSGSLLALNSMFEVHK